MKTVLVIGAGASVAEALARHSRWTKDRPPLDLDFFARAKLAAREPSLVRRITQHAVELGHPDPFDSKSPTSLEHYLGLLYFRLLHRPSANDKTAYFDLLRLYNRELLSTTNWLVGRKRGPLETLVRHELGGDDAHLTIVTFNHDLLAENALESLPARTFGRCFCAFHSYGFEPGEIKSITTREVDSWEYCTGDHGVVIPICKLHGSLNWVFTTRDLEPSVNLAQSKKALHLFRVKRPRADARVLGERGGRGFYLWPVVVPPIYEKQGFIRTHLQTAWDRATEALAEADRVVFFGYSFPGADHHARFFFEGLAGRNENLKRPVVVNPDFGVARIAWEVLGAQAVHCYRSLDEYLADG